MAEIEWESVESSNLAYIGYDEERQDLQIQFRSGAWYAYSNVPDEIYEGLMNADSKGQYFNENIKGKFEYQKVG